MSNRRLESMLRSKMSRQVPEPRDGRRHEMLTASGSRAEVEKSSHCYQTRSACDTDMRNLVEANVVVFGAFMRRMGLLG